MSHSLQREHHQKQEMQIGNVAVHGQGHYIDLSQKQIIQIASEEIKHRPFIKVSPYKGLKKFEFNEWDTRRFWGREKLILNFAQFLSKRNLIILLGASGSGKSSLVSAGLIPKLTRQFGNNLITLSFTPDEDPFESLYASLLKASFKQAKAKIARQRQISTISKVVKYLKNAKTTWLIFVDQFEEIFTISQEKYRSNFIKGLVELHQVLERAKCKSVKILISMRADFSDQFSAFPELSRIAHGHVFFITNMQNHELRRAIEQPAAHHGVVFEEGLVDEIIKDVEGQAGALPLLQYTLDSLWKNSSINQQMRTLRKHIYWELGGVSGTLQNRVDEIYAHLCSEGKDTAAKKIFLRLVNIDGSKIIRRRAYRAEFVDGSVEDEVIFELIQEALLVSNLNRDGHKTIEIAHEALFTSWRTFRNWIAEDGRAITLKNRLADSVSRWLRAGPNDAHNELFRGSTLNEAIRLINDGSFSRLNLPLNLHEKNFIDASINLHHRTKMEKERVQVERIRLQKRAIRWLVGGLMIASMASGIATWQWRRVENQKNILLARQLAAHAQLERERQLNLLSRAALLSIESLRRFPSVEASHALRSSLSLLPIPSSQIRHNDTVIYVDITSDGKFLISLSNDQVIKIFDLENRKLIVNEKYKADLADVELSTDQIILSPDGKYVALTDSKNNNVSIHEVNGFRRVALIKHNRELIKKTVFTLNSQYILTQSELPLQFALPPSSQQKGMSAPNYLRMWKVSSGQPLSLIDKIKDFAVSGDDLIVLREGAQISEVRNTTMSDDNPIIPKEDRRVEFWMIEQSDSALAKLKPIQIQSDSLQLPQEARGKLITLSPNGKYLTIHDSTNVKVWKTYEGQEIADLKHEEYIYFVGFSPNEQYLVTTTGRGTDNFFEPSHQLTRVFNTENGQQIFSIKNESIVESVSFSPDSQLIHLNPSGQIIEIATGKEILRLVEPTKTTVAFSPDNQFIAVGDHNNITHVMKTQKTSKDNFEFPNSLIMGFDDKHLVIANRNNTVRVWNIINNSLVGETNIKSAANIAKFSASGRYVAILDQNSVQILDVEGSKLNLVIEDVNDIDFSLNEEYLVVARGDKIEVWSTINNERVAQFIYEKGISKVTFNPNNRYIAALSGQSARIWDRTSGEIISDIDAIPEDVLGGPLSFEWISFSPDGQHLAVVPDSSTSALIWDIQRSQEIVRVAHNEAIQAIRFSSDSNYLATADSGGNLYFWQTSTGHRILHPIKHEYSIWDIVFSTDGKYLATASSDYTARVWEIKSGKEIARLGHETGVFKINFSSDGKQLVTAARDQILRLWVIRSGDLISETCNSLTRNFTLQEWQQYLPEEQYRKTCPNLPIHSSVLLEGVDLAVKGELEAAVAIFNRALKLEPGTDLNPKTELIDTDPEATVRLLAANSMIKQGEELAKKQNIEQSVNAYREAQKLYAGIDLNPETEPIDEDPEIVVRQIIASMKVVEGRSSAYEGKVEQAISAFEEAQELDPNIDLNSDIAFLYPVRYIIEGAKLVSDEF